MQADEAFSSRILEPISFLRVDDFNEQGILIKCLGKVTPADQWDVSSEFRRRILKAFEKHHISLAVARLVISQEKD